MPNESPEYIAARCVLLDALIALRPHLGSAVLVGAQAVYLRTSEMWLDAVQPYTTDADLVLDPAQLMGPPPLSDALEEAGFERHRPRPDGAFEPGVWRPRVPPTGGEQARVDLIVPESVAGTGGRRAARLHPPHGKKAARKCKGLEGALVDRDLMTIRSLDDSDNRSCELNVAGPAALLVAKVHKLHERLSVPERLNDKDASDVLRLLAGVSTEEMGRRWQRLLGNPISEGVSRAALPQLDDLFARASSPGVTMACRALSPTLDSDTVATYLTQAVKRLRTDISASAKLAV